MAVKTGHEDGKQAAVIARLASTQDHRVGFAAV